MTHGQTERLVKACERLANLLGKPVITAQQECSIYDIEMKHPVYLYDRHRGYTCVADEKLADLQAQAAEADDLRKANGRLVRRNVELKKQVHEYQCELVLGQRSVAYDGLKLAEARQEIDRLHTENLRLKQIQEQQARIIRNQRKELACYKGYGCKPMTDQGYFYCPCGARYWLNDKRRGDWPPSYVCKCGRDIFGGNG